jgi:hypothetical protein
VEGSSGVPRWWSELAAGSEAVAAGSGLVRTGRRADQESAGGSDPAAGPFTEGAALPVAGVAWVMADAREQPLAEHDVMR